eukprot:Hpha_TRINITY_DN12486_c0_g2::TRINITY_DN12486_c0_g2_i1::g.42941::m.42941/K01580/E4.1.1.15, gadB, gadA, GAD; glutamate decarboxylase
MAESVAAIVPHRENVGEVLDKFASRMAQVLIEHMRKTDADRDGDAKVVDFLTPDELKQKLDLDVKQGPATLDALFGDVETTLKYSVNTSHIRFFNQLFAQVDAIGVVGEWITSVINTSMYTYEVAPVFILVEEYVLQKVGDLLGYTNVDGIFAAGGSQANLYAMLLARHRTFPHVKKEGWRPEDRPVVFSSEHSHYSTLKGCIITGLGTDRCVSVKCDKQGRMCPKDLEAKIEEYKAKGFRPFYVCGTAGTTVLGAYDDLDALGDVCKKHGLWLHTDGAWGGAAMLSPAQRHNIKGIEKTDSFAWCAHKMTGAPLQCSLFVCNDKKGLLQEANGTRASYLFQPDKLYPIEYDTGDKSIQCGRKVDCFKLWLLWKARGDDGMAALVDKAFASAQTLADAVERREGFELVAPRQCANVCFRYLPKSIRDKPQEERDAMLDKIAPRVKRDMQLNGSTLVGYQRLGDITNFWRMICVNPNLLQKDIDWFLDTIQSYSEKVVHE